MYVSTRIVRNSLLCSFIFASASALSVIKIPVDTYAAINKAGETINQGYKQVTGTQTINNQNAGNWAKFIGAIKLIGSDIAGVAIWAAMPIKLGDGTLDAAGIQIKDGKITSYPVTKTTAACISGNCIVCARDTGYGTTRLGTYNTVGEAYSNCLTTIMGEFLSGVKGLCGVNSCNLGNVCYDVNYSGGSGCNNHWKYFIQWNASQTEQREQTYTTPTLTETEASAGIDCSLAENKKYSQCGWDSLDKSEKERILARIRTTSMGAIVAGSDDVFDDYIRGGAIAGGNKSSSTTEEDDNTRKTTTIDQTAIIPAEIPSIFKDINKDAGVIIPVTETTTTTTTTTDKATGTTSTKTGTVSNTYNINIYPTTHEGNTINNITNNNVISGAGLGGARTIDGTGEGTAEVDISKIEDAVTKIGADPADTPIPELELQEWGEIEIATPEATDAEIQEQAGKIRKTITEQQVIQKAEDLIGMHSFNYETFGNSRACPPPRKMRFLTVEFDLPFDLYCDYIKQMVLLMVGLIPLGVFIYFLKNLFIHG